MTYRDTAQQFGNQIARSDYSAAWELLTKEAQASVTPEGIKAAVTSMIAYASGPIQEAQLIEEFILEDWPGKQPTDLAVAYVALIGDNFSEAVMLTLAKVGAEFRIRHIEWGRP